MSLRSQPPIERVARALCRINELPQNSSFDGAPMWRSFTNEAEHIIDALKVRQLVDFITEVAADTSTSDAVRRKARSALAAYQGKA